MEKKARKPSKERANATAERRRFNVLLENIHADISLIGEGQRGLRSELDWVKAALNDLSQDMSFVKPIIETLRSVPNTLDGLDADVKKLSTRLDQYDQRLTALEAR